MLRSNEFFFSGLRENPGFGGINQIAFNFQIPQIVTSFILYSNFLVVHVFVHVFVFLVVCLFFFVTSSQIGNFWMFLGSSDMVACWQFGTTKQVGL